MHSRGDSKEAASRQFYKMLGDGVTQTQKFLRS